MAAGGLARIKRDALRWSVTIHRWTGVVTCVFFLVWFASGAVMVFCPFPSLGKGGRLAVAEPVDPAAVKLSPTQAFGPAAARLRNLRLVSVAGAPLYIGAPEDGPVEVRSARTGAPVTQLTSAQASAVAEYSGRAPALSVAGPIAYDQWIVNASYNAGRPFYRVRLAGPQRIDLYVASRTGEVFQRTTAVERGWAWVGSIIHWAYYTVLGQHRQLWNQVCWWGSLFAFGVAILGMVLGVERYLAVRRAGRLSPFPQTWMRWHHIAGLFTGVLVLTWMGSGWLSNDNHRLFSSSDPDAPTQARYDGARDPAGYARIADDRFVRATEVAYVNVGGTAYLVGRGGGLTRPVVVEARSGKTLAAVPLGDVRLGVAAGWPGAPVPAPRLVPANDFYAKAEGLPDRALRFDIPGERALRVFVDQDTGTVASVMDRSRRASAWLYYGLHTLQLPGLVGREALRKTIECLLLLLGASVAATGVVLGVLRLKQTALDARVSPRASSAAR
jgi:hypothetical protein